MSGNSIYSDIAKRTGGDIYIGVVGPVRTGKSTFIHRFLDCIVMPNIENEYDRDRTRDEMPQSGSGKTIMTTEPKFVPDEAVRIRVGEGTELKVKMVDCVGYMVDGAMGAEEEGDVRMVHTPWSEVEMPFAKAAELGTQKVIGENVSLRKEISTTNLRADVAEERADELGTKVRIGSVIRASGIRIVALNDNSKEVRRIKMAKRLRVDFELTANELAEPGEKSIYICITPPDGYVLSSNEVIAFNFDGTEMMASAMRKVDYENQSVPVSIFYDGAVFDKGTYKVDIYIDGRHSGSQETYFE